MSAHELAKVLLDGPDVVVVVCDQRAADYDEVTRTSAVRTIKYWPDHGSTKSAQAIELNP